MIFENSKKLLECYEKYLLFVMLYICILNKVIMEQFFSDTASIRLVDILR